MSNEPPPYPGDLGPSEENPAGYHPPPPPGTPPTYGGYSPAPGPRYDAADAIGYGWRAFRANTGPMLGATAIVLVGALALYGAAELVAPSPELLTAEGRFELDGGALLSSLIAQTIVGVLAYVLSGVLIRGSLDVTEGRSFSLGEAFGRLPVPALLVTGLLLSVLSTIGIALCILPGLIFSIFSFFTVYYVVDRGESPVQALGSSFALVGRNFGPAMLSGLLAFLVFVAGALALLVGLLVAVPLVSVAGAYAYRLFNGQPAAEPVRHG